jgi:protoporphyrinogen oxidase
MSGQKLIVIGAGISGIAAAINAKKLGYDVLVIESNEYPGGIIDTYHKAIPIEFGAHSFYNSYKNCLKLIKDSAFEDQIVEKKKLPFLFDGNDHFISIFKCLKKVPMAIGMIKWYLISRSGQSVGTYYANIFGQYNYQNVLKYCFNAVLSQDAHDFPADLLFNVKKRDKSLPRCFGFKNGMRSFIQHLIHYYQLNIKYSTQVKQIVRDNAEIVLMTHVGKFKADKLVIASNVDTASHLLKDTDPQASKLLKNIVISRLLSCAVEINSSDIDIPPLAGIIGSKDSSFFSIVSSDPFINSESKLRGFVVHFKYSDDLSKEQIIQKLCAIFKFKQEAILDIKIKEQSVPMLKVGHQKLVNKIDTAMNQSNIYLTGNYFNRLAVEDCVERSLSLSLETKKPAKAGL